MVYCGLTMRRPWPIVRWPWPTVGWPWPDRGLTVTCPSADSVWTKLESPEQTRTSEKRNDCVHGTYLPTQTVTATGLFLDTLPIRCKIMVLARRGGSLNRENPARISANSNNVLTADVSCLEGRIADNTADTALQIVIPCCIISFWRFAGVWTKIQEPEYHPNGRVRHSENGESLKPRITFPVFFFSFLEFFLTTFSNCELQVVARSMKISAKNGKSKVVEGSDRQRKCLYVVGEERKGGAPALVDRVQGTAKWIF